MHPPKFSYVARFLHSYAACPAALAALSVFVVFADDRDQAAFEGNLTRMFPELSRGVWTAVNADVPSSTRGKGDQMVAAWKKWYGVAYMMDLGVAGPRYGLMADAELLLYSEGDCQPGGAWDGLLGRIQAAEASKAFPAARIDDSVSYDFGNGHKETGRLYDQALIRENFGFVLRASGGKCAAPRCKLVQQQIDKALFSWWTDIPFVNLEIAARMLPFMADSRQLIQLERAGRSPRGPKGRWRDLARNITFPRFEIIAYQQWCVLHEDFEFRDVTNLTNFAKWGSYLEEPRAGARITDLTPMWISSTVFVMAEKGQIPPLSTNVPPLLVFHVDHEAQRFKADAFRKKWDRLLLKQPR